MAAEIDRTNAWVGAEINAGVYRVGFAPDQASYDQAVDRLLKAPGHLGAAA